MGKSDPYYAKFICPFCHKRFRQKVYPTKDPNGIIMTAEGLPFEYHVHCPVCETYIPVKDRRNHK